MIKLVLNPYKNIDWQTVQKCRADLHAHTTESDGGWYGSDLIKLYKEKGEYKIFIITDHDSWRQASATPCANNHVLDIPSYPWSIWEGSQTFNYSTTWDYCINNGLGTVTQPTPGTYSLDNGVVTFPDGYKMITGKGVEYTRGHHINAFFNCLGGYSTGAVSESLKLTIETGIVDSVLKQGGMCIISHPAWSSLEPYSFYHDLFTKYPVSILPGCEVIVETDSDLVETRGLWDDLLKELMPGRPIWAYSNDDVHSYAEIFKCYQYFLLPDFTQESLKSAMVNGQSFVCYDRTGNDKNRADFGKARAPMITNIATTDTTITITATNYTTINWIYDGTVISTGATFNFSGYANKYIRAEIINSADLYTYTQPFGFRSDAYTPLMPTNKYVKVDNTWI